ncbi:anaerobic sulfatase-maturating enzyme [Anaerotignum neopropionicum]|uniref:Anaerobic sulfatase-maturating enzyme n=1 Tax=Anaerotignum neopropionicum TaxID=36847 RepID=A0A136WDT2_9FIRM|nr:radical SAM protein [Anaerotignum neopropionicum]KXL52644.1 anaerobic sulfatase-maturating enzyme [Anaerotignum neopropionicum]
MRTLSHTAERMAFSTAINAVLHSAEENREKTVLKLIDLIGKFMSDEKLDINFNTAKELISNEESALHKYTDRLFEEVHPHVLKTTALNLGFESFFNGTKTIRKMREIHQCNVPWLILMDPTSACNLHCTGCWAAEYGNKLNLSFEEMDRVITQGKELGIYFYMMTGGEPLVRKADIIRLCKKHNDCAFLAYTNGTLVDEAFCKEMQAVGNFYLAISLEGFSEVNDLRRGEGVYEKVMYAMDLLKKYGLIFGTSICYTSKNIETVVSEEFVDLMIEKGCRYAFYFHYMPVGNDAVVDLLPTVAQRKFMHQRVREIRNMSHGKGLFTMDFQNDGEFVGGCIAGGRNYFHINANGDAEPCVFIHFSNANIRTHTLLEILKQPIFMAYYNNQPFNKNHLRPCPMLENPEFLEKIVKETGAKSTDLKSPESAEHLCAKCQEYAKAWAPCAEDLWEQAPHAQRKYENYKPENCTNHRVVS